MSRPARFFLRRQDKFCYLDPMAVATTAARRGPGINSFADLRDYIDRRGGIHTTSMGKLRDLQRAGKLGVHVVNQIERNLRSVGLAILLPAGESALTRDQNAPVVLYLAGSKAAELIAAVHRADAEGVKLIRDVARDNSGEKLEAIRAILDE